MAPEIDPQNLTPKQIELINEGRKLEGVDLTLLGYFGGPELQGECIGRMQLDDEGRLAAANYDSPEERLRSLVLAQSLRGALRQSVPIILDGIFEDVFAIRTLEATGGDTGHYIASAAARVVHGLPSAYRDQYTSEFLQRFAVVLAEVAADLEMGWDGARTFAHELAAYCFARKGVQHADAECGTTLGAVEIDRIMVGLLEDATGLQEAYHPAPHEGSRGVFSWFEPYDAASRVNPYLHPEGQLSTEQLDLLAHQVTSEVTEKYPGAARRRALMTGELVDISPYASRYYFLCPVAVEQTVLDALRLNDLPADAQWEDLILHMAWHGATAHPAWRSFSYIAPGFEGEETYVAVVAGTDDMDSPVLTIQHLGEVIDGETPRND